MLEEIDFQDSGERITVTIDNESIELPINKINRLPTYIELNQSLNTALESNIKLDANIFYVKQISTNIENEEINTEVTEASDDNNYTKYLLANGYDSYHINIDGTVTVTIYNGEEIYYIRDVFFRKGNIIDNIDNTLPLGSYKMIISYSGNKYFEPSQLEVNFNVEKRLGQCIFDKEVYYGDLEENLHIMGKLIDNERNTPVNNCELSYDFDDKTYTTSTNSNGEFYLNVTIPSPDISHCFLLYNEIDESDFVPGDLYEDAPEEEFIDEDGNIRKYSDIEDEETPIEEESSIVESVVDKITDNNDITTYYPNASYILNVYTDNASYYLNNTEIEIIVNKAPVLITSNSTNSGEVSNTVNIIGSVLSQYNDKDNDAQYGEVDIVLPDFHYNHLPIKVIDGIINTDINLIDVYSAYNKNDVEEINAYDTTNIMNTSINVSGDIYNENDDNYISVGDSFVIEATVLSVGSTDYVSYGALLFSLMDEEKNIVYQYETEVDRIGMGIFNFNTSKESNYYIQVEYLGIFGYQYSKSSIFEVRVKDVI